MESSYDAMKQLMGQYFSKKRQTGIAIAMLDAEKTTKYILYGYADSLLPISLNTVFQVASLSKPVTAWGVMKLVESGMVELDSDVNQYLTRWQIPAEFTGQVTIRKLLSHTAGLRSKSYIGKTDPHASKENLLRSVQKNTKFQKPTNPFQYSGAGYTVLQLLVEDVTGMDFESYMHTNVLNPIGMPKSTFQNPQVSQTDIAKGHLTDRYTLSLRYFAEKAAAGLYSTAKDYSSFLLENLCTGAQKCKPTVLHDSAVKQMHQRVSREIPYGLGFALKSHKGVKFSYHEGVNLGWRSCFLLAPVYKKGILIMTNFLFNKKLMKNSLDLWVQRELPLR